MIWFSPTWSLELYQQANKRLHRQGQTERVIIHRLLVDGSVDHDVVAALEGKADTQEALMESIKARIEQVRKGEFMTTKDWLNRGWALDREITALESAKRRAYDRCVSGVASVSGAPGGGGASDGGLSRYADFAAQVDAQIDKLIDIKQEIAAVITEVPDTTLRTLLTKRYLNFEKWEKIAVDLDRTLRWVMRLHGRALQAAEKILKENANRPC